MVKDLGHRPGRVFKGAGRWCHATSLWDVRHLPDVRWCSLRHASTVRFNRVTLSVTKAGGLSDTPGAERSTGGGSGDTVTYSNVVKEQLKVARVFQHQHYISVSECHTSTTSKAECLCPAASTLLPLQSFSRLLLCRRQTYKSTEDMNL